MDVRAEHQRLVGVQMETVRTALAGLEEALASDDPRRADHLGQVLKHTAECVERAVTEWWAWEIDQHRKA